MRLATGNRALAARAGDGWNGAQRRAADRPATNICRPDGYVDQRIFCIGRRYFSVSVQDAGAWQTDRETHVGWRYWYSRVAAARRWRPILQARIRAILKGRQAMGC